jgi:hypothetical protein
LAGGRRRGRPPDGARCSRAEFVATSHVDDDVPNSLQLQVLDQEICLLQSAAVWHVLAVRSGVEVVSEVVYREALQGHP